MSAPIYFLLLARFAMLMAFADCMQARPFGWPEWLAFSYALGIGATL